MGVLSEFESKQLLASHGIVVSRDRLARSANEPGRRRRVIGVGNGKLCGPSLAPRGAVWCDLAG